MTARTWPVAAVGAGVVVGLAAVLRRLIRLAGPGRPDEDAGLAELRRAGPPGRGAHDGGHRRRLPSHP